jgi:POT family proton-dependent oligopeptide transporter
MTAVTAPVETGSENDRSFLGHPRGLSTLFLTEMWERFSFYGLSAILVLYLVAPLDKGGLGMAETTASALFGVYVAMIYVLSVPGGWLADRVLGSYRAVLIGGIVIAMGHLCLAWSSTSVYLGLSLVAIGTGLLKPNISTMVGLLYSENDSRRDAGFSLFYMGVNIGAFFSPFICGYLGESINWHLGLGAAMVGMILGVTQYVLGRGRLDDRGKKPTRPLSPAEHRRFLQASAAIVVGLATLVTVLVVLKPFSTDTILLTLSAITVVIPVICFVTIMRDRGLKKVERSRIKAFIWLFILATGFWMVFQQMGSTLNLFAKDETDRNLLGFLVPASWLQSVNAILVIALAPVFAIFWVKWGRRISTPMKFAIGLSFAGVSFVVMSGAAALAVKHPVSLFWLVGVYFLQTIGELSLSPVGLSVTTKLSPPSYASRMMGVFCLSVAVGGALGGQASQLVGDISQSTYFLVTGGVLLVLGLVATVFSRRVHALMGGVS